MRIAVLIKQVPDTWDERRLDLATGRLDRDASERVIDEIDERALEAALTRKDADRSTEVVVIAMGPSAAVDVLRKGLSMGADSAVHVLDPALAGADQGTTARALAAVIGARGFDLVIAGNESTDGRGGVVPAMIAEYLGLALLSNLDWVEIAPEAVRGVRNTEDSSQAVSAGLPALVSVTERANTPRFPTFKGVMTAKKKPLTVMTLDDLAWDRLRPLARSVVLTTTERPPRAAGRVVVDDGSAASELVEFLTTGRLI